MNIKKSFGYLRKLITVKNYFSMSSRKFMFAKCKYFAVFQIRKTFWSRKILIPKYMFV